MLFWRRDATSGDAWITVRTFSVICVGVALVLGAVPAAADANTEEIIAPSDPHSPTIESGWQAGTCNAEPPEVGSECSVATPSQYFELAAAHPNWGFTQFIVRHTTTKLGPLEVLTTPVGELKDVRVDLPVGLSVNPGATERCPLATFELEANNCPAGSVVGKSTVEAALLVPLPTTLTEATVYNIVPKQGEAARFGLELLGNEIFLEGDVASAGDYHEGFTIHVPKAVPVGLEGLILRNRLIFNGRAGDGTFLTTPSTCLGEAFTQSGSVYSTFLRAASYAEEERPGYSFPQSAEPPLESPIPPGTSPKSCNTIPYTPSIGVAPGTAETNAPAPAAVTVAVPHIAKPTGQDDSTTQAASLSLPVGMGINPSAAAAINNLKTCDNSQFVLHSTQAISCPAESRIGTATIASAALPEGNLEGPVFIGRQESTDPASGNEYRIFIDAASARYGIDVRLLGHVAADPTTGQLTTTISEVPQVPFTSFKLDFIGGQRSVLSSPPTCGPNTSSARMTPYSGTAPATPTQSFSLQATPGGSACATSLAARPFAPSFAAAPKSTQAGAYSPLHIAIGRTNGQQELKGATVTLPPGMIGKLAGIPYCPANQIAAAATTSGASQEAKSSCPAKSEVGTATVQAGTAATPLSITGKVFLSGPYHGAPLSLAVITPATAGPFDLGTVVVRVALLVDPGSAQVTAVSDPIPDVFGGSQLSIRQVAIDLSKKEFTLNPTSCDKSATTAAIAGGGANPAIQSAWSIFAASAPFQTSNCEALKFRPKLVTRFLGGKKQTRRAGHPKLQATLTAREGDANIARATLTLPRSELIDQGHIKTICTRPLLAAHECPDASIYGYARAESPLLDDELAGPVYLVPSTHVLPDLLADLRGQVEIQLHGVVKSVKGGRIRSTFSPVPDVPVSKFVLTMQGGKKG
ncbi:MAG: hypothetical protein QOH18_1131, partial [Solirubrobacterales bacterium]|nr:hypothetical protein [Solirubrobacterales bacterium]